ncbi:MAG: Hsp70 family protein [Verrucomicrobia subdivision 3 bacterium]|nr:Hsp70 family protein [Limisphaerales bacterium]
MSNLNSKIVFHHSSRYSPRVSTIVGIDLGTTRSAIAVVEAGMAGLLADADGQRLLPSVVHYPKDGVPIAGWPAQRQRALDPARTIYSIKRFIGQRAADVPETERHVDYTITGNPLAVKLGEDSVSPETVSAEILKSLKTRAESVLETEITRAVITVPAYFNDAQRQATQRAGVAAGFTVERILNEPTAAALACGLEKLPEQARVAVYDLGGGTFDLSVLELREGIFQVLSTHGNTRLGGDDIDQRIVDWLLEHIDADADETLRARVREAAEAAKVALSTETEATIQLPFVSGDTNFECVLTREKLEALAAPVIDQTRAHCRQALADAGVKAVELNQVILVGGQTRMPLVRRSVSEWFECADYAETRGDIRLGESFHEADGPTLNTSQNPDEAVALGAAIQGAILSGDITDMVLLDVTPLSLGLETFGGLMNVVIPRNTTVPTKAGEMFTNAVDGQRQMLVHVLQGEREKAVDNWSLGQFDLEFESAKRGAARVGVQFEIDADGILHVLARDTATGYEKVLEMKSAVDVDDTAVQKMVEESVEHAFEDMDARKWIEAALKAREAVKAARVGLEEFAGELNNAESIASGLEAVEVALKTDGDLPALKTAVAKLDEATLPLADLMMDRAMETVLRQRGMLS